MKDAKVWLVLGATDGLGPAAVKYLLANKQLVIPVETPSEVLHPKCLAVIADMYGPVDFIVNNSNYRMFAKDSPDVDGGISATVLLLSGLTPYLRQEPRGSIINIPPQLCVAVIGDKVKGEKLLKAMDLFLNTLRYELSAFDCGLRFLEPGERLV